MKIELRTQRHFNFDSLLVGQFEISVTNVIPEHKEQLTLSEERIEKLVKHFLNLKVKVLNPDYDGLEKGDVFVECSLYQLSKYLPIAYCKASTYSTKYEFIKEWWVQTGHPVLFLEIKQNEDIKIPSDWQNVIWESGIIKKFQFYWGYITNWDKKQGNFPAIPIFIFKGVSTKDYRISREVRAYALKLLAETECLDILSRHSSRNLISQEEFAKKLKEYNLGKNNTSFYKCVLDEKSENFRRSTLIKLKEARGDVSQKIKNLLNNLTLDEINEFFKKAEEMSSSIANIIKNITTINNQAQINRNVTVIGEITVSNDKIHIENVVGTINVKSKLDHVSQIVNNAPEVPDAKKQEFISLN